MQSQFVHEVAELDPELTGGRGDTVSYRQLLENIQNAVPFSDAFVVTTLPRGSLQIMQPARVSETLLKNYQREMHLDELLDRVHEARHATEHDTLALTPRPRGSIFVFNQRGDELLAPDELSAIDSRVREQLIAHVQRRLNSGNGRLAEGDRLQLPD